MKQNRVILFILCLSLSFSSSYSNVTNSYNKKFVYSGVATVLSAVTSVTFGVFALKSYTDINKIRKDIEELKSEIKNSDDDFFIGDLNSKISALETKASFLKKTFITCIILSIFSVATGLGCGYFTWKAFKKKNSFTKLRRIFESYNDASNYDRVIRKIDEYLSRASVRIRGIERGMRLKGNDYDGKKFDEDIDSFLKSFTEANKRIFNFKVKKIKRITKENKVLIENLMEKFGTRDRISFHEGYYLPSNYSLMNKEMKNIIEKNIIPINDIISNKLLPFINKAESSDENEKDKFIKIKELLEGIGRN